MKKLCILEHCCNLHQSDFLKIQKNLEDFYVHTAIPYEADVIFAYFCAVSATQFMELADELLYISKVKKPGALFIVAGCAVNALGQDFFLSFDYVDYAFKRESFAEDLVRLLINREIEEKYLITDDTVQFTINIVDGCVRKGGWCNFCKQHYLQIPVKSVPIDNIVQKAREMSEKYGISVISLGGLNTCNYGIDLDDHTPKLHLLIKALSKLPKIKLINITGITIGDMYEELEIELASNPKIHRFELGIQHGCDEMLNIMNVHSTTEQIRYYLKRFAGKAFHSIVVIGHPGETMESVEKVIALIEEYNLWHMQVSPFINTPNTPSFLMEQLPEAEYNKHITLVKTAVKKLETAFMHQAIQTMIPAYFKECSYDAKFDTAIVYLSPTEFSGTLKCSIHNASTSELFHLMEKMHTGDKVLAHVTSISKRTNHGPIIKFDKLEVI